MTLFRRLRRWIGLTESRSGSPAAPDSDTRPPAPPDSPAAVALQQAQTSFANGDFAQASEVAAAGLAELPGGDRSTPAVETLASALHGVRGGSAARLGKLDEAIGHFEQSMEHARASGAPEALGAARLNLVDARTRHGDFPAEDPSLGEAVDGAEGTAYEEVAGKLLVERGVALLARGDLPAAIEAFDRVLRLRPAWPFPMYQRAWARFLQGDSGGALDDYREVARKHPVFFTVQREIRGLEDVAAGRIPIDAYRSFCLVRGRVAENAEAVMESAERMVERHPDFAPAWVLLAETRLLLGRQDEARDAAREALRHDPDPDTAVAALFAEWNLARRANEGEAAREVAERIRTAYPDYPANEVIERLGASPDPNRGIQWTWALDGTLRIQELVRRDPPPGPATS